MKPYASYKPSGVPWLGGDIPSEWAPKRVKHVATMQSGEGITAETIDESGTYPVYGGNGIRGFTTEKTHSGEFVLVGRQGALCGNVHHVVGDFWASEHAVVTTLYAGDKPRWAAYILEFMNLGQYSMAAAQPGLAVDKIQQLRLPVPPPDEQQAIADYLDAETARIDTLIHEKDELIGLLREWRQSVIAEAITKGLNKDVAMKASDAPWLGNVPKHWEVQRLRFRVKLNPPFSKPLSADLPVSFLPMEAVGDDGTLDLERTRLVSEVAAGYTYFEDGDVTIAKITPCYENGKGAVMEGLVEGVGFGTTELIVMRPIQADCPKWLYYVTKCNAFRFPGEAMMLGAGGQKRVPDLFVKDYFAPVPPRDEQQAIADYLDAETAKIDDLIAHTNEEITLLKELRAATIADAVLGRVDVRTAPKQ